MRSVGTLAACSLLLGTTLPATGLELGDQAPPLKVKEWVKGQSVELEQVRGQKIVVLDFWATWCVPCIANVPHLTRLQEQYAEDVIVIALTSEDPANSLTAVRRFVESQGKRMDYRVAFNDGAATQRAYMDAMGLENLPTAFVVDREGRLAWVGYPDEGLTRAVEQAVAGKLDIERIKRQYRIRRTIEAAIKKEDWPAALAAIDTRLEEGGLSADEQAELGWLRFECLARSPGRALEAGRFGRQLVAADHKAERLDAHAWALLTDAAYEGTFNALALAAAERANALAGGQNARILDTLARAHFVAGKVSQAVRLARQAVAVAEGPERDFYRQSLAEYQEASRRGG
jgi:thiol-disulfide isomerase/thioredoxin